MQHDSSYQGKPAQISQLIMSDAKLEWYPFRAALALQIERMLMQYSDNTWTAHVRIDFSTTPAHDASQLKLEITTTLGG